MRGLLDASAALAHVALCAKIHAVTLRSPPPPQYFKPELLTLHPPTLWCPSICRPPRVSDRSAALPTSIMSYLVPVPPLHDRVTPVSCGSLSSHHQFPTLSLKPVQAQCPISGTGTAALTSETSIGPFPDTQNFSRSPTSLTHFRLELFPRGPSWTGLAAKYAQTTRGIHYRCLNVAFFVPVNTPHEFPPYYPCPYVRCAVVHQTILAVKRHTTVS